SGALRRAHSLAGGLAGRIARGRLHAAHEVVSPPADDPSLGIDHVLPTKPVFAGQAGVAPSPSRDRANEDAAGSDGPALDLAEYLITTLVRPDTVALPAGQ